jgi:hypothetical protein
MKNCLHLASLLLLLVTMLTAPPTAAQKIVVLGSCAEDTEYTITVPFRLPDDATTVRYEWYRNGVAIPNTQGELALSSGVIEYVIPADSAQGDNVEFHFMYWVDDDCDMWVNSPTYVVGWYKGGCMLVMGEIELRSCSLASGGIELLGCTLSAGGVELISCTLSAGGVDVSSCTLAAGGVDVSSCTLSAGGVDVSSCTLSAGGVEVPSCTLYAGTIQIGAINN